MESSSEIVEVIVVGSGLTGAQACQTLCEAGVQTLLLDGGIEDDKNYGSRFPDMDFISIRKNLDEQRHLFLGDDFEGIPWGNLKTGAQLTPPRQFIMKYVDRWLSIFSDTFFPMESLAFGGLGNAWGTGCFMFSEKEFENAGYSRNEFMDSYQKIADRIGITTPDKDAVPYTVEKINNLLPCIHTETSIKQLELRYEKQKAKLNKAGFYAGKPSLAITTKEFDGRGAYKYLDMEFWHDNDKSFYRPRITFDKLKQKNNFSIIKNTVVISFREENNFISVFTRNIITSEERVFRTKKLALCSGVLGTARILLRSYQSKEKLPILCNPYSYIPMLHFRMMGGEMPQYKPGIGQWVLFYDRNGNNEDVSLTSFFIYRSLMLFRLIKESPLNFSDGRILMQYLLPAMVIGGIHHPEKPGHEKYIRLIPDNSSSTGDTLETVYRLSSEEQKNIAEKEKKFFRVFRSLGIYPIKKVNPGHGSSIHYAGTLPVSEKEKIFTTAKNGLLHGTKNVYIADGSSFRFLPAKGISFTLMANAHRVATNIISELTK